MEGDKNPTLYDYLRQFHSVYETGILTDKAVVLYWQMVSMFNACGWKQWVGVDTARLMAMIHETNKTTAYRARDKLVHAGLIAYQKGHKGKPSVYALRYGGANEAFFSYNSVTENVSENVTENVTENATHNKTKDLRLKTGVYPPNPPAGGTEGVCPAEPVPTGGAEEARAESVPADKTGKAPDAEFERFWEAYPRQQAKGAARKAFAKARKKVSLDVMLAAIERQKASWNWTREGGQYIPQPASWLNGERWNDNWDGGSPQRNGGTEPPRPGHVPRSL